MQALRNAADKASEKFSRKESGQEGVAATGASEPQQSGSSAKGTEAVLDSYTTTRVKQVMQQTAN